MSISYFEKIWTDHIVLEKDNHYLIYVDQHLVQDGSAPAFEMLRKKGLSVRRPGLTFGTPDHYIPTLGRDLSTVKDPEKIAMAQALEADCAEQKINFFGLKDSRQGIIHVVAPEQGITQPGQLLVCGDSHTATHGAMGAIAFGIGASEVAHVLATQTIWMKKPKEMRVSIEGRLNAFVSAKDLILYLIGKIGSSGATGHVIQYSGNVIRNLNMEGRMTICNMSIEAGARSGYIIPDEKTFNWLKNRPYSPISKKLDTAFEAVKQSIKNSSINFDKEFTFSANDVQPMITWGNSPQQVIGVNDLVPYIDTYEDNTERVAALKSMEYMGLKEGQSLSDLSIDQVFIGSCTNGRIDDLRVVAEIVNGKKVAKGVSAWIVPGSGLVKEQAEKEGLDIIFKSSGFQWRDPGCSMCLGTNGDQVLPGKRSASTSNRNFVGRQGPGSRTHLMSPASAAASAITGRIFDVREI